MITRTRNLSFGLPSNYITGKQIKLRAQHGESIHANVSRNNRKESSWIIFLGQFREGHRDQEPIAVVTMSPSSPPVKTRPPARGQKTAGARSREPQHIRPRAEPLAGLVDTGPGERAVVGVGRPGRCGPEEHRLGAGAGDKGAKRDGPDAVGHGARALLRACPRGHGRRTRQRHRRKKNWWTRRTAFGRLELESGARMV